MRIVSNPFSGNYFCMSRGDLDRDNGRSGPKNAARKINPAREGEAEGRRRGTRKTKQRPERQSLRIVLGSVRSCLADPDKNDIERAIERPEKGSVATRTTTRLDPRRTRSRERAGNEPGTSRTRTPVEYRECKATSLP